MAVPPPLRMLLLQLLPILAFLAVDALVQDPLWAIGAALVLVLLQAALLYRRDRRLDLFVLLDVGLIGGLGVVSLVFKNDLFFKLKPAIMEAVIVPFFLLLALGGERMIQGYFGRFLGGAALNPQVLPLMRRLLGVMGALILVHAGVVVWAALRASRQTWGWISGPGFYAVLAPVLLWALVRRIRGRRTEPPASINTPAAASAAATSPSSDLETLVPTGRKRLPWRELLRRVFSVDALVCPRCLGPMTVIATITEAAVLTKILTNLGLPTEPPALSPARGPAQLELFDEGWGSAPRRGQRQPNTWRSRAPPGSTGAELVVETDELPEPEYDWGA